MKIVTTIYCLKDPTNRNRIFYVGKTILKLSVRLSGHIRNPTNRKMADIIRSILIAGKKPVIQELEICTGYLQVYKQERFWVKKYNKRKYKLVNSMLTTKKKHTHFYW